MFGSAHEVEAAALAVIKLHWTAAGQTMHQHLIVQLVKLHAEPSSNPWAAQQFSVQPCQSPRECESCSRPGKTLDTCPLLIQRLIIHVLVMLQDGEVLHAHASLSAAASLLTLHVFATRLMYR